MARTARQSRQLKKRFLEVFGEIGIISRAAETVGIDRNTVYYWQEHDEFFAAAFQQADARATEVLETEARRRAVEGVTTETPVFDRHGELLYTHEETKYSDTLLIFLLKARNPGKYRERIQLQHADAEGQKFPLTAIRQALGISVGDDD